MVLIYLINEECVEVSEAVSCDRTETELICFDAEGVEVCSFNLADVSVYTADMDTADLVKSEVCDEETTTQVSA